jgi:hypothetical protein
VELGGRARTQRIQDLLVKFGGLDQISHCQLDGAERHGRGCERTGEQKEQDGLNKGSEAGCCRDLRVLPESYSIARIIRLLDWPHVRFASHQIDTFLIRVLPEGFVLPDRRLIVESGRTRAKVFRHFTLGKAAGQGITNSMQAAGRSIKQHCRKVKLQCEGISTR